MDFYNNVLTINQRFQHNSFFQFFRVNELRVLQDQTKELRVPYKKSTNGKPAVDIGMGYYEDNWSNSIYFVSFNKPARIYSNDLYVAQWLHIKFFYPTFGDHKPRGTQCIFFFITHKNENNFSFLLISKPTLWFSTQNYLLTFELTWLLQKISYIAY